MTDKGNRLLHQELTNLKRRGVPDTDPRVRALRRIMEAQNIGQPKEGIDFPAQITFDTRKRQP
jgi:hypothetical protein